MTEPRWIQRYLSFNNGFDKFSGSEDKVLLQFNLNQVSAFYELPTLSDGTRICELNINGKIYCVESTFESINRGDFFNN